MTEDELLLGRLKDLANRAHRQSRYTFTNFLSYGDMDVFYKNIQQLSHAGYRIYGGREDCDRVMISFGDENLLGYSEDFPIDTIHITPVLDKFSDELNHRDFLGALMNLGIKREMLGDILVLSNAKGGKKNAAYLFCVSSISDYIISDLTKIKHTNVRCSLCSPEELESLTSEKEPLHVIAASARIDAVISAITGMSRSQSSLAFREKKISLNGRLYENSSYVLKPGDTFSVKGYGKFTYVSEGSVTKKGRLNMELVKFV